MVCLLIQIVQKQMGEGLVVQTTCDKEILERCKYETFRGRTEKIPWGRLRVYITQQMQGQSKSLQIIVVCRNTLHSTSKVMRLSGESFSMRGSLSGMLRSAQMLGVM